MRPVGKELPARCSRGVGIDEQVGDDILIVLGWQEADGGGTAPRPGQSHAAKQHEAVGCRSNRELDAPRISPDPRI